MPGLKPRVEVGRGNEIELSNEKRGYPGYLGDLLGIILPSFIGIIINHYKVVSKNRGIPKWMVKTMENPIKMEN